MKTHAHNTQPYKVKTLSVCNSEKFAKCKQKGPKRVHLLTNGTLLAGLHHSRKILWAGVQAPAAGAQHGEPPGRNYGLWPVWPGGRGGSDRRPGPEHREWGGWPWVPRLLERERVPSLREQINSAATWFMYSFCRSWTPTHSVKLPVQAFVTLHL